MLTSCHSALFEVQNRQTVLHAHALSQISTRTSCRYLQLLGRLGFWRCNLRRISINLWNIGWSLKLALGLVGEIAELLVTISAVVASESDRSVSTRSLSCLEPDRFSHSCNNSFSCLRVLGVVLCGHSSI